MVSYKTVWFFIDVYNIRGLVYLQKGDPERAVADFNKAIEGKPDYAEACSNRGNAFTSMGDIDRAIKDYDKALALDRRFAEAYYGRAEAFFQKGDYGKCRQDLNRARALGRAIDPELIMRLEEVLGTKP